MKISFKHFLAEIKKQIEICLEACSNNKLWLLEGLFTFIAILIMIFYHIQAYSEMFRSFFAAMLGMLK